jgi:predicted PurR-regulated permease PerM
MTVTSAEDVRPAPREARWAVPMGLERAAAWSWRMVVVAAATYGLLWLLTQVRVVVIALFVALVAAAALEPAVTWLQHRGLPRLVATWMAMLALGLALAGLLALTVPRLVDELGGMGDRLDEAIVDAKEWLQEGPLGLTAERVAELEAEIESRVSEGVDGVLSGSTAGLAIAVEVITGGLLAAVLTFFFAKDGRRMWAWIVGHLGVERRAVVDLAGQRSIRTLRGWLAGTAIAGLVDGVLIGAALAILGVPLAFSLAVLTFFGAFFPIVGATVAGILATLVALVANGFADAVIVAVVVLVVQQVEGDVILPVVMSRTIKLHPVVVLIALTAGGATAGVIGALVAVPLTAVVVAVGEVVADRPVTISWADTRDDRLGRGGDGRREPQELQHQEEP